MFEKKVSISKKITDNRNEMATEISYGWGGLNR